MSAIIQLKGINRTYNNGGQALSVLKNIDLTINSGEFVAIIGPSGSGKSTLMHIMGCLDIPDRGDYYIHGKNAAQLSSDEQAALRREHIGFIFQRYHLIPGLNALENVEIPAVYASQCREQRRQQARILLKQLGLKDWEEHKPGQLSGGQQQRVCIARSLINSGEIILADEPTGALDVKSGQEVLAILRDLNQRGHTVVIVTHDMKIAQCAQRIIELEDGRIVADKSHQPAIRPARQFPNIVRQSGWRNLLDRTSESLSMALKSMDTHRLRTLLTMIGIVFSIAAVVTVVALGEGAKQRTLENIKELGTNLVSVYPSSGFFDQNTINRPHSLLMRDVELLKKLSFIDSISPEVNSSGYLHFHNKSVSTSVIGVGNDYFRVNNIKLIQGRSFHSEQNALQEVIIDENAQQALFGRSGGKPLGKIVILNSVPARVIGIANANRDYAPNQITIWMPYSTVMYRVMGKTTLNSISIRLRDDVINDVAVNRITQLLIQLHGRKDFSLFNRDKYRKSIEKTTKSLNLLILIVALISLAIGCLGVMNIMLVSVTERTHEIGVRMAVGARRKDIMQQFMIEAILICLVGGVFGIALSYCIDHILTHINNDLFNSIYSWQSVIVAFLCSTLIGMVFGYLPARKAAKMEPVSSLASE